MTARRWNVLAGALLVAAAIGIFWDADRPFQGLDEIWQSGEVAGMLVKHQYLVPLLNGEPHFDKPPLFHWLSLPIAAVVDNQQVAMRIVPGLCGLTLLWLVGRIARRHISPSAGFVAMLVFLLSYDLWYHFGHKAAVMEGLLNLELALVFWLNSRLREKPHWLRWIGLLLGLIALTKTTFPVIPAVFTGVNLWWLRKDRPVPARLLWQSILIAAAVALPWFIAVIVRYGQPAIDGLFIFNIWHRVLGHHDIAAETGRSLGRREPWYVLQHYLTYGQPWSLFVWPALLVAWRERHTLAPETRRLLGLAAVWFGVVVTLFLLSQGRWHRYIYSAYFPAALLIAAFFARLREPAVAEEYRPVLLAVAAAGCIVSPLLFAYIPYYALLAPLDPTLPLQLFAACLLLFFFGARMPCRVPRLPVAREAGEASVLMLTLGGLLSATTGILLAVFLSHRSALLQPFRLLSLIVVVPMILECGRRLPPAACGRMVFSMLVLIAGSYLTAPLQFPGKSILHPNVAWMEYHIRRGTFEHGRIMQLPDVSYYLYVALAQTYHDRFDFSYDPEALRLTIRPRPPAPHKDARDG